jgi:hypothetical protein
MPKLLPQAMLADILSDPIVDAILARDQLSRDDLHRMIDEARQTVARVPRKWRLGHPNG